MTNAFVGALYEEGYIIRNVRERDCCGFKSSPLLRVLVKELAKPVSVRLAERRFGFAPQQAQIIYCYRLPAVASYFLSVGTESRQRTP